MTREYMIPLLISAVIALAGCGPQKLQTSSEHQSTASKYQPFIDRSITPKTEFFALDALPYESISMERQGCYGGCPFQKLIFHKNLKAEVIGYFHIDEQSRFHIGNYEGEIDLYSYGHLCYLLDRLGFLTLEPEYSPMMLDAETIKITVTTANREISVTETGRTGPIQLWGIEHLIDNLRHQIKWRKLDAKKEQ